MTDEYERAHRITDLHSTIAIQIAALTEIAKLLRDDGMDEDARYVTKVIAELGSDKDLIDRVSIAVVLLRAIGARMVELEQSDLVKAVTSVRKTLARRADLTLVDTLVDIPIDYDALGIKPPPSLR